MKILFVPHTHVTLFYLFPLQIDELRADLEHQHHTEATLHRKNEELEELLQQRLNQTETMTSRSFSNSEEIGILQEEVVALQSENVGSVRHQNKLGSEDKVQIL